MRNIRLEIEYDGTNFLGWEIQPKKRTVRGEIERKLEEVLLEKVKLIGAGRTDAGVHAICQVANFITRSKISIINLKNALLALPPDIYVKSVSLMPLNFDARRNAISKTYLYRIFLGRSPLLRTRVWEYKWKLNINEIKDALPLFLGVHRFDLFSYKDEGECEIKRFTLSQESCEIYFEIEANRFLHKMVRMIIGSLMELGRGKISKKEIQDALNLEGKKYLCAPPSGLYLKEIKY